MLKDNLKRLIYEAEETNKFLQMNLNIYTKKVEEAAQNKQRLIKNQENLLKSQDFIELLSKIKKQDILILEKVVNNGLAYTYPHRNFEFYINFVKKRGKIEAEFILNDKLLKSPFKGEGGGIITIISLLLYIAASVIKRTKVLLLDEAIKMVDIAAATKFLEFIQILSKEKDLKILLISHKNFDYPKEKLTNRINISYL